MYMALSYWQVALAAVLVLINGALSAALSLGLGRQLLIAAARMVAQLLLVGGVLRYVFATNQWAVVLAVIVVMTVIATAAAVQRPERTYPGMWLDSFTALGLGAWPIGAYALVVVIRVDPWYQPQYAVPLLGMILGNTLGGVSLGLSSFSEAVISDRDRIEAMLSLGASRAEAARLSLQRAVRTGMVPTINGMVIAGIVSLPGMMTGQLLSGIDPVQAVKYQIVVMFLICAGASLGTVGAALLAYRRLFSPAHQLQGWLLQERVKGRLFG